MADRLAPVPLTPFRFGAAAISARAASTSQSSWLRGSVKPKEYTSRGDRRSDGRWPRDKHSGQTDPVLGRFLNRNLSGYLVPTNADIPKLDILFVGDFDE